MRKSTFLFTRTKALENSDYTILNMLYPREGVIACIQCMSVTVISNAPSRVDVGFIRGNDFIPLESYSYTDNNFTVAFKSEIWTYIDDQPACRIYQGVFGDTVQMTIAGYILYDTEQG
jgi:hypothetical protein